jgi:peptide/nickel transport system permease protein
VADLSSPLPAAELEATIGAVAVEEGLPLGRGRWLNPYLAVGGGVVLVLALLAVLAPILPLQDPNALNPVDHLQPIGTPGHPLGTDQLGRDMLSRLIYGGRITLVAGLAAALISTGCGVFIGLVAGYFSSWIDIGLMRLLDVLLSFPFILLAILIVAFYGPSTLHGLIAIAVANLPFFARLVRAQALQLRERTFVEAARALGVGHLGVLGRHLLRNLLPLVVSALFLNVGWMISQTSALSFLGLGTQPPTPDWGTMLADGQTYMAVQSGVAMLPGIAIVIAVVGFNVLGLGLKGALNPEGQE